MKLEKMTRVVFAALLVVFLIQCSTDSIKSTMMTLPNDPFTKTIAKVQTFDIDSKEDNVVEGESGTIIICPMGSFKNGKGEIVEDQVKIELAEALSFEDMLLSNLTTTSDGKLLETDGMIYFNATSNGEQLIINKDNPIHIEIPTDKKKPGMMAYKGIRDENGTMNWIEPKAIDNFLTTVDIDSLDFLPEGFQLEVDKGMPFRKYKVSTKQLTDSLYYSLAVSNGIELVKGFSSTDENEPYYQKNDDRGYDTVEETQSDSVSSTG